MSPTAPKPPSKLLLVTTCITGGVALGIIGMIWIGHVIFDNIPTDRLVAYTLAWMVLGCVTGILTTRYLVQKHRRDAWWDGFAAGDEPLAEVIQLRDLKGYEGSNIKFINGSPS